MALPTGERTFADVCALWLADRSVHVLPSTLTSYEGNVRLSLVADLGKLPAGAVTKAEVRAMHLRARDVRGPSAANQALQVGRMIWAFAVDEEIVGSGRNPFTRIQLWPEQRRRNPLDAEAVRAIWNLCESILTGPPEIELDPNRSRTTRASRKRQRPQVVCTRVQAAYIQAVLLTGMRRSEVTHLRHDEFDGEAITIATHKTSKKTGPKRIELHSLAREHFVRLSTTLRFDEVHYFPSARSKRGHIENPLTCWNRVRSAAGVSVGTIHDARRGFATILDAAGATLSQIGKLLGHTSERTTSIYVQPNRKTSRAASELFVASTFPGKEVGRG